ncbi:MAG: VWA domain-containing protein [Flavobacteriales bacterium]|nr:VWA domain-containing protein [Flavobacteriales bacterium]
MITKRIKILLLTSLLFIGSFDTYSQQKKEQVNRILFIFDASQSMLGRWQSGRKIDIARKLLYNMLDSLKTMDNLEIGLRVYGHQKSFPPQDCDDTRLEVDFGKSNDVTERIKAKLKMIRARGTTPIAISLEKGAYDFPKTDNSRNIIILITDGREECNMDPCSVSRLLQREGIILKPFVIGVGLDETYKKTFDCVGTYYDASKEKDFETVLQVVISHVLNSTTAQVNLLDESEKPTETNVNLTFYDESSALAKYNFVHTMNHKGNPDTMSIDPILKYKVVAHTIPSVESELVSLTPGKHTIIPINTPQGFLEVKMQSKKDYQFIIRKSGESATLHVQETNTKQKYLTGKYDIEVLTIPRFTIKGIEIKQSKTTTINMPNTGTANILLPSKGYGGIYRFKDNLWEQVYPINDNIQRIKLYLLPGNYKIVFRSRSAKQYMYTNEKDFKVQSGKSKLIKLY